MIIGLGLWERDPSEPLQLQRSKLLSYINSIRRHLYVYLNRAWSMNLKRDFKFGKIDSADNLLLKMEEGLLKHFSKHSLLSNAKCSEIWYFTQKNPNFMIQHRIHYQFLKDLGNIFLKSQAPIWFCRIYFIHPSLNTDYIKTNQPSY